MVFTAVLAESETCLVVDAPKVAVSAAPLGIVAGIQLPAVFQLPLAAADSHLALPATAEVIQSNGTSALYPQRRMQKAMGTLREKRRAFIAGWMRLL
jgi:hypothetical protein